MEKLIALENEAVKGRLNLGFDGPTKEASFVLQSNGNEKNSTAPPFPLCLSHTPYIDFIDDKENLENRIHSIGNKQLEFGLGMEVDCDPDDQKTKKLKRPLTEMHLNGQDTYSTYNQGDKLLKILKVETFKIPQYPCNRKDVNEMFEPELFGGIVSSSEDLNHDKEMLVLPGNVHFDSLPNLETACVNEGNKQNLKQSYSNMIKSTTINTETKSDMMTNIKTEIRPSNEIPKGPKKNSSLETIKCVRLVALDVMDDQYNKTKNIVCFLSDTVRDESKITKKIYSGYDDQTQASRNQKKYMDDSPTDTMETLIVQISGDWYVLVN